MAAHSRAVHEALVGQHYLRPVVAGLLEFHGDERVANAVFRVFSVPGEQQAQGPLNLAVDPDGYVRFAVRSCHT